MSGEEMTAARLYRETRNALRCVPVDNPEHEALLLCEKYLGINGRAGLTLHGGDIVSPQDIGMIRRAVTQRAERPLQYILGEWDFCGMSLAVGEGVLVPREDTVPLVDSVIGRIKDVKAPVILDLCAGSGAVGLAIVRAVSDARCVFVELSSTAEGYLTRNVERYGDRRCTVMHADVLAAPTEELAALAPFDVICSNPPYIPTDDIAALSREVRQEPFMALDGGADGLEFYRAIGSMWLPLLRDGGCIAVEAGQGQHEQVKEIFVRSGVSDISYSTDINGIYRTINGTVTTSKK